MFNFLKASKQEQVGETLEKEVVTHDADRLLELVLDDEDVAAAMGGYLPLYFRVVAGNGSFDDADRLKREGEFVRKVLSEKGYALAFEGASSDPLEDVSMATFAQGYHEMTHTDMAA